MSSYYREQGFHSRKRFLRRLRYIWALLILGILVLGGFFVYDAIRQNKKSDEASNASAAVTSLVVSSTQLQSSPYFQFQSPKNWRAIANESRSNHFVYREYNGPLIEQELVIDINRESPEVLALVQTTRVLPIKASSLGKLTPNGAISDHCKNGAKPAGARNPLVVTYKEVKFNCNPETSNYIVVVGLVGGTNDMLLKRPSGGTATYNITYKDLTAQPTGNDLDNMIETFETR
jgi:hypothetical protein